MTSSRLLGALGFFLVGVGGGAQAACNLQAPAESGDDGGAGKPGGAGGRGTGGAAGAAGAPVQATLYVVAGTSDTKLLGKTAGTDVSQTCPAGSVLTSIVFEQRTNDTYGGSASQLRIGCSELVPFKGTVIPKEDATYLAERAGTTKGGALEGSDGFCPIGGAVASVKVFGGAQGYPMGFYFNCREVKPSGNGLVYGAGSIPFSAAATGSQDLGEIFCPEGQFAGGMIIEAGAVVNRVGLRCQTLQKSP